MSTDALAGVAAGRGSLDDESLARALLDHVPGALWLDDPDGRRLWRKEGTDDEWVSGAGLETTQTVIRDDDGNVVGVLAIDVAGRVAPVEQTERQRRQFDSFYRLIERASDAIALVDVDDGTIVEANHTTIAALRADRDDVIGLPVRRFVPQLGTRWLRQAVTPSGAGETPTIRVEVHRADGTRFPVDVSVELVEDDDRRYFVVVGRDVSSQVAHEQVLQQAADQYRALLSGTKDGFLLVDTNGIVVDANDTYAHLSGYARGELVGRSIAELNPHVSPVDIATRIRHVQSDGSSIFETAHRRKDGTIWPVEVSISYADVDGGRLFTFFRDLTERQRAAEAIELSARWFDAVLAGSSDGFLLIDTTGTIVDANETYARLSGFARDELLGLSIDVIVEHEGPAAIRDRMASIVQVGSSVFESVHRRRDGSLWPVEVSTSYTDLHGGRLLTFVRDITDRKRAEQAIRDGADRYRMLLDGSVDGFARITLDGTILEVNARLAGMFGWPADGLVGRSVLDFDVAHGPEAMQDTIASLVANGAGIVTTTARRVDGTEFPLEINLTFGPVGAGQVLCFARDITDRVEAEQLIRESADRYAALLAGTTDGFCMTDLDGRILEVNPELCRLTGYEADELVGMAASELDVGTGPDTLPDLIARLGTRSSAVYETDVRRKDGSTWRGEVSLTYWDQERGRIFGFVRDVSERREAARRIEFLAFHDPLTELPNRQHFAERLGRAIDANGPEGKVAVCLIDLDGFKPVNDTYGHEVGDVLLVQLAQRLRRSLGPDDVVARIGGDEFVVMIADLASVEQAAAAAERLITIIAHPFDVEGHRVELTASVGVTVHPDDDHDADTMLRHADQAMYEAKEHGAGAFVVFDPVRADEADQRRVAIAEFEVAIAHDQLVLHFQPRIELATGRVVGAEALVRWQHPTRGLLPPAAFLPLVEGSSLELALDEWVLGHALAQLEAWLDEGLDWSVSVNVSPRHIAQPTFPETLAAALAGRRDGVAERLELEVLETSAIGQVSQVADVMLRCAELGVSFSLDDFGTGYSSLTYFHSLPVNVLKIDQDFVRDLLRNLRDLDIVEGVVQLASALDRPVVAEGVESIEIGVLLLGLGCRYAQGFGIARPMPAEAISRWHADFAAASPWRTLEASTAGMSDRYDIGVAVFTHRRWVHDVLAFVEAGGTGRPPATSSTACPVGRWHRGVGRARYGGVPGFDELGVRHRELHETAAAITVHAVRDGGVTDLELDRFRSATAEFAHALEHLADGTPV